MNRWKKLFKRSKKGMSLMVVLVSIAMLVVMGTMFTTIAMRSFNYSYSRVCKQQAYYTAESAANALADLLYDSDEAFEVINNVLYAKYEEIKNNPDADITQVYCNVGKVGGASGLITTGDLSPSSVIYTEGLFTNLMGTCDLRVRYTNEECTEMSLEAVATYRGYTSTIRMRIAKTSKGAEELKKIFANSFCWSNPIVSMVGDTVNGNITITTPGDYVRDANGNIIDGLAENQELKDYYSNVQVYDGNTTLKGHTKEFDVNNYPLRADNGNLYPADWAEIYLFSGSASNGMQVGTILNGDMYVQSRALLGLWDKDKGDKENYMTWNYDTHRKQTNNYYEYDANGNYDSDGYVEHNFNTDVFFDHADSAKAPIEKTKMRINGDIWLWKESRIENLDSLNTENAYAGIKNNIYALDDLIIDGFCYMGRGLGDDIDYSRNVTIYGDVMVQGDLQISSSVIVGDIYCNGDNLYLFDTTVFGNIYFRGSNMQMDWCQIYGDDLTVYDNNPKGMGQNLFGSLFPLQGNVYDRVYYEHDNFTYNGPTQAISGGNVIVAGLNSDGTPNENARSYNNVNVISDEQYYANVDKGVNITNSSIVGTYYSNVNTIVNVAKWTSSAFDSHNTEKIDVYGDLVVNGYLFLNLRRTYSGDMDVWTGPQRCSYLEVDNIIAKKVSIAQSQKGQYLADTRVNDIVFTNIYTEEGGYLLGNNVGNWVWENSEKSVLVRNVYSRSGVLDLEDTNIDTVKYYSGTIGVNSNNKTSGSRVSESEIISGLSSIVGRITGQSFGGTTFESALQAIKNYSLNKFDNQAIYNTQLNNEGGLDLLTIGFPNEESWESKEVNMRAWNAPKSDLDGDPNTTELGTVQYIQAANLSDLVSKGGARYIDGTTIEINSSVEFTTKVLLSDNMKLEFNSIGANLHIKFNEGLQLGNNCDIILKGGHMTFLYLYGSNNTYSMTNPHLLTGLNCNIGEIHNLEGVTNHSDSLYIISNDVSTMRFGAGTILKNTFVYAPESYVALDALPTTSAGYCFSEGSLAVKGFIMSGSESNYQITIDNYTKYSYTNTEPPLITDSSFEYGNSFDEVDAYGVAIWDFVGYY